MASKIAGMTAEERLAKIERAEQKRNKAREAHAAAKTLAKAKKELLTQAEDDLYATIRDDPEGALGFTDSEKKG